jgi:DnaJ-class molecular chaperone
MKKPIIIKKSHTNSCPVCSSSDTKKKCRCCNGTGKYNENSYVIIYNGIAFAMDNLS